jgi:glycosyltransferase involved in cell wall biosynthesis
VIELNASPRILYVSTACTPASGGEGRCLNVLRALQQIGTVDMVILKDNNNGAHHAMQPASSGFPSGYSFPVERRRSEGLIGKLRWTLDPKTDYPNGWRVREDGFRDILHTLPNFDLIWFFTLRAADMFPNARWPRSVVDIDDVPSTYARSTLQSGRLRERILARRNIFAWTRREALLGDRFTVLAVCSANDEDYLERIGVSAPVHVIPNGFERPCGDVIRNPATPPRIGFVGVFRHYPNYEGITWFANHCWPRIKRAIPDARLRLIGKDSDGPLKPSGPDIDGLGWLPSPSEEIKTWSLMVVPVRVGAGTRVKIAHGLSEKCPIVSTSFGANGYELIDTQEVYLADSIEDFSAACIRAIQSPDVAAQVAERAWRKFVDNWAWDAIRPRVWAAAEHCLQLSGRPLMLPTPNPGTTLADDGSCMT